MEHHQEGVRTSLSLLTSLKANSRRGSEESEVGARVPQGQHEASRSLHFGESHMTRELSGSDWNSRDIAPWRVRSGHRAVIVNNTLVLCGGHGYKVETNSFSPLNDVWISNDLGASWQLSTVNAGWAARSNMAAVSIGGTIIIMGGFGGEYIQIYFLKCSSILQNHNFH